MPFATMLKSRIIVPRNGPLPISFSHASHCKQPTKLFENSARPRKASAVYESASPHVARCQSPGRKPCLLAEQRMRRIRHRPYRNKHPESLRGVHSCPREHPESAPRRKNKNTRIHVHVLAPLPSCPSLPPYGTAHRSDRSPLPFSKPQLTETRDRLRGDKPTPPSHFLHLGSRWNPIGATTGA